MLIQMLTNEIKKIMKPLHQKKKEKSMEQKYNNCKEISGTVC